MFNSISNNFGAPQIQFKDYQAPNYVVLNAKVTFDPTNAAYQACDQLEITVPDLTIDRSTIGGVENPSAGTSLTHLNWSTGYNTWT